MVEDDKVTQQRVDDLDRMRLETEAVIAQSTKLIEEMKVQLEELRQLRLAHEALLKARQKNK